MMILETASNIVVPDQLSWNFAGRHLLFLLIMSIDRGEAWHRLRREDLSQVDLNESPKLVDIIKEMMRTDPSERMSAEDVCLHPVVARTREKMDEMYENAVKNGTSVFVASPLASVPRGFLEDVLATNPFLN
jgi:mitosis inhibitor protein kinase SWE1